jgi:hypothetical protein
MAITPSCGLRIVLVTLNEAINLSKIWSKFGQNLVKIWLENLVKIWLKSGSRHNDPATSPARPLAARADPRPAAKR